MLLFVGAAACLIKNCRKLDSLGRRISTATVGACHSRQRQTPSLSMTHWNVREAIEAVASFPYVVDSSGDQPLVFTNC